MNYRTATVLSQESATTAATKTIDLEGYDPFSRLTVRFEGMNNGHVQTGHPALQVSKIEIVEGSEVLMSLSGMQAQALDFYDTGRPRPYEIDYRNDLPNQEIFNLNFGRWLWDPELAFDPRKFQNPQLKITHNKALGGSAPDAANLSVYGDLFDKKSVSPSGWLMAKNWYSYTPTASAYTEFDLPKDHILRKILIQDYVATYSFTDLIDEIRIDEENLKVRPIDLGGFEFINLFMNQFPLFHETISWWAPGASTYNLFITPGEYAYVALGQVGAANTAYLATEGAGGKTTVTTDSAEVFRSIVTGYMPHGCLPIPFGIQSDPTDWYDITTIQKLRMRLHAPGTSAGTVNVVLQQLRRY